MLGWLERLMAGRCEPWEQLVHCSNHGEGAQRFTEDIMRSLSI